MASNQKQQQNNQAMSTREQQMMLQAKKRKELPSWWIGALFFCFILEWVIAMCYVTGMFERHQLADGVDTFFSYTGGMVGIVGFMLLLITLHWFHNE